MSVSVRETFTLIDERSHFHSSHFESFLNRRNGKAKRVPPTRCIPASKKIATVSNSPPSICITFIHRSHLHERKFAVKSNESRRTTGESRQETAILSILEIFHEHFVRTFNLQRDVLFEMSWYFENQRFAFRNTYRAFILSKREKNLDDAGEGFYLLIASHDQNLQTRVSGGISSNSIFFRAKSYVKQFQSKFPIHICTWSEFNFDLTTSCRTYVVGDRTSCNKKEECIKYQI